MKINKWVKFRIIMVFIYIIFFIEVLLFRFAYIQLKNQLIIGIIVMILFAIILAKYIIRLSNETFRNTKIIKTQSIPKKYNSIIDFMTYQKLRNSAIGYFILLTAFIVNIILANYWSHNITMWSNFIILLVMLLMFINVIILEFRISNRYYGTNDYEAREIINFILSHVGDNDFEAGDHFNKLFTEIQDDIEYITHGSPHGYNGIVD